ncbi:hypothetical protein [Sulfitobacter sp.]|uniref:hypothetical protein n=1 Tax=Sulfitobacter sp. TaxID=1903071 RepID=UPI0030029328
MFENAKKLILKDRDEARKALRTEMKADEASGIEAELDQLAAEAAEAEQKLAVERDRAAAEALRAQDVASTRNSLSAAAANFDAAAAALGVAFDELELLQSTLATLEPGARADVNMRKWGYVRGLWFAATPLCKRLGIARTMGSKPNTPLAPQFKFKEDDINV